MSEVKTISLGDSNSRSFGSLEGRTEMGKKIVTLENVNPNFKNMEYAVLGPLAIRSAEIEEELKKGVSKPFNEVIRANFGDCQAMGQKPLTFLRQVLSLCANPALMTDDRFPNDVKERAKNILNACGGSVGVYTECTGLELVKRHIAQFIERRDGFPASYSDIVLRTGATEAIQNVLYLINHPINGTRAGVMIPIPQYPLYSSTIAEYGMHQINYYLDEDNGWGLNIAELRRSLNEAKRTCVPRALIVNNPGNPSGAVLSYENIEEIIKFAFEEKLLLMADEVYQGNVYGKKFHSFKKVLMEMGDPYCRMEMVSFMSASKGYMGECGLRSGYAELINFNPDIKKMLLKLAAVSLCPNVLGQVAMYCAMNPPQVGEPSYDLFMKEKTAVMQNLTDSALLIEKTFSRMKGIKSDSFSGSLHLFPRLILPEKAIEKAKSLGQTPDFFYVMQLLENTGVCVVPGSAFGQKPGTFHFRITIIPQPERMKIVLQKIEEFHNKFLEEYK